MPCQPRYSPEDVPQHHQSSSADQLFLGLRCHNLKVLEFCQSISDKKKESDHHYVVEGIPVYVDKKHTMYLIGKEVDFYDGEDGRGFTFVDVGR